jgi:enhancing lycopene biosynthesis protein 2
MNLMSRPLFQLIAWPLSAAALATLVACGGGGGSTASSGGQQVAMSTYITDAVSDDYSQVWVGVLKITAIDTSGAEVTLFSSDTAQIYNLSSLDSVGQLMAQATIPAGTYRAVRVTLADQITLVDNNGASVDAFFTGDGSTKTLRVEIEYNPAAENALVLDFDLARFTTSINASGQTIVSPIIVKRPKSDLRDFIRNQAEVHGTVVSVDAANNQVVVNDSRLGNGVAITLATDGVVVNESTRTTTTLASLSAGMRIEAKGTITSSTDTTTATVQASVIKIESSSAGSIADTLANRARGEGTVVSYDSANKLLTVALSEASFLPEDRNVVVDVNSARFAHGSTADLLVVGASVSFKGALNTAANATSDVIARVVDVEGASSDDDSSSSSANVSEVEGTITAVSGTVVTVSTGSTTYTVETAGALIKEGRSSCLVTGATLEAKGTLSGTTLTARVLEVKGGGCVDNRRRR